MSAGVSQIEYWREPNKPDKNNSGANAKNVTEGGPGAIYLSYDVFLGLTVIGGLLALDHLYLRSPLTFLAKLIVNILTLGTWWLYDASQAVFNKDVVKVYGLGVPGMGPKGIAAGVLASDVPDKKHMAFFIYGLALLIGGIFGLDSFIVGDKQSGIIRIVCLITGILAPIALIWWLMNVGKFLLKTKDVTSQYWEYFGAPPPVGHHLTFIEKLVQKFPFLDYIVGPINKIKNMLFGVVDDAEELGEAALSHPIDTLETVATAPIRFARNKLGEVVSTAEKIVTGPVRAVSEEIDALTDEAGNVLTGPIQMVGDKVNKVITNTVERVGTELKPAIESALQPAELAFQTAVQGAVEPVLSAVQPLKNTLNTGLGVAQEGLATAKEGLALGKSALNDGTQLASNTLKVVGQTANAATKALTLAPAAAALTSGFTPVAAAASLAKLKQEGGGDSGILPYVLMGTFAMIVVSGLVLTYRRYRQNGQPRKDDSPPEPGVLRKSNQEKSS
jgi:hypothetical protein